MKPQSGKSERAKYHPNDEAKGTDKPLALTEAALQQHDSIQPTIERSTVFVENLIQEEQAREYHREAFYSYSPHQDREASFEDTFGEPEQNVTPVENDHSTLTLPKLHRRTVSSPATPMQRYMTPSTVNEPFPLLAMAGLEHLGHDLASFESVEGRKRFADALANESALRKRKHEASGSGSSRKGDKPERKYTKSGSA